MSDRRSPAAPPLPKPEKRPTRQNALVLWAVAAAGLVLSQLLVALFVPVMRGMNPYAQLLITNLAYYGPFVVLPVLGLARRTPGLYEAYRPNPISLFDTISIAFLALVGVFFVNDITVLWAIPFQKLGLDPMSASLPSAQNVQELMLAVVVIAVIPAVCEEFLFRGAIMSGLEGRGTKRAMWITSILFMLVHGSFAGMPAQVMLGMVLAMLVFWCDSIYAGLIYHTVHNAATVILDYVQSRTLTPETAVNTGDLYAAIGGMPGVLSLLFGIALSGALFIFTLRLFRMRGKLMGVALEEPAPKAPLTKAELIALIVGGSMCALLYGLDIFVMLGGLAG